MPAPTSFVARHATDPGDGTFAERLDTKRRLLVSGRSHLPQHPHNARGLYRGSLLEAGLLQLVEPESPAIVAALRRAGRAVVACCALVSPGEGPVVLDIEGEPVSAQRWSRNNLVDIGDFVDGFYAALAAGDDASLDALAQVDVQALRVEGVFPEEYQFHWARALQGFQLGTSWTTDVVVAALRESAPEHLRNGDGSTAYMFFKSSKEIELLIATATDPDAFNAALLKALENHRHYFSAVEPNPGEDQSNDPLGFIALGPLAFAAAMARRGWPITVASDYLPRSVLAA